MIGALVTSLSQGRGGVLVIEGPPGIGKSRLLTEVLVLADKCGARTLFGEAFEYQQTVPFFSLFMATLNADPPVGDAEALRQLGGSADLRYWVVHDLADAIHAAAAQTPVVIVLEDIHWADNGTLLALRSLTTARPDAAVLWILTARTGAGGPAVQETLSVLQRANATFLRLGAMTPDAVADMVCDAVRAKADVSLLNLAAKAHGNPFLVSELVRGLGEEDRLNVTGGRAVATGYELPRRLGASMHQRLDLLSDGASEVVRVAAVLPDRFSAGLLAAMLERSPTSLLSALEEAVRADLFVEDGEQLRFRHDLLREATRQSLPQSLRRAMERQSASVMLGMGAAPAEVATQLARSAEPGDREAIEALRQAAQSVGRGDASAAADLSKRALELLPSDDPERGSLVGETVGWLNRASRYGEAEELADVALAEAASPEVEAEIRLRLPVHTKHTDQRRVAENRRALELSGISDVTRARHLAWLAYNLVFDEGGQRRAAADEAAAAAAATGDLEAMIMADVTLALLDAGEGYTSRALGRFEELSPLAHTNETALAHAYAGMYDANLLAVVGRLDDATARVAGGIEQARREGNAMTLAMWAVFSGLVHLAAGRLSAARDATESLPPPQPTGATEHDVLRMVILAEVAAHTDDRNLLQQMVNDARDAHSTGSAGIRRGSAYVLARAAWQRDDLHDAMRWLGDVILLATPFFPHALVRLILGARVASAAGDAGLRARVLQAAEVLERERPAVPLLALVAGYARAILERDAPALVAAADALRSSSRPLLYASAAEDAGGELSRAQRNAEAIDQLNAAFDTYIECGATADARRVARALRGLGMERRILTHPRAKTGWDSLTDSELTVVHLIAEGATNRSVAQQLHLSPHTVKTHVRNAFAKLGITSRTQLAQLMHGSD
ncbi:LuxR C-terminal-related transcriptional regulator [Mycobacterium intracellulare subsp. chimaera]|nr:LuxR family transcriptional regulator [Mycobacterium intracellulare]ETZ28305.1 bacterial regulatory s, luxR family protein [Mycobacterium intracellulare MIN_052511_1280]MCF1812513.1 LuxR C-terminal-related transcriptional regulator [Mycobacterium intracellulare subsp. intracellulare]MDM3907802.1 LuxR C-terminal-related transcriptional regulator [Mycobacterium intracellulare subsp. chimaera]MDM3927084.1 LuxR C-terminal-related transcriptional regulator [Mycobacterium intracellulare subsp. chi